MDIKDTDQEAALIINREINANPRHRSLAVPSPNSFLSQSSQRETRASKRARTAAEILLVTPISAASTPTQSISMDASSSPLTSQPTSDPQSPDDTTPSRIVCLRYSRVLSISIDKILSQPPDNFPDVRSLTQSRKTNSARGSQGLTNISISDADSRSQPLPGPELLQIVEEAKDRGEIPKLPDSNVVRRVDGKWMAPQICKRCQQQKKSCDRKFPCSTCSSAQSACNSDSFMTILRSGQASKSVAMTTPTLTVETGDPMVIDTLVTQNQPSQNSDQFMLQDLPASASVQPNPKNDQRKKRAAKGAARKGLSMPDIHDESEATASEIEMKKGQKSRSKKRKTDDEDFAPGEISSTAEVQHNADIAAGKKTNKAKKNTKGSNSGQAPSKYYVNVLKEKPEPYGQPLVWADKRQQLCEALPYYNAHQSAAHSHDKIIYGFMCDKEVSIRDVFDDEIMISRVGGGRKTDEETGRSIQGEDQTTSKIGESFTRSKDLKVPIAVISGQGNSNCPSKLPHYYNVLDWFHVTHVWCDKIDGKKCWMVRLEKINLEQRSWWSAKDSLPVTSNIPYDVEIASQTCRNCGKTNPIIYQEGWACLEATCASHFKFSQEVNEEKLVYNDAFLKGRTKFLGAAPGPISPALPTDEDLAANDCFGVEKEYNRGIVCPQCRCCIRRLEWLQWSCENPSCDFTYSVKRRLLPITEVTSQSKDEDIEGRKEVVKGGIRINQELKGQYKVTEYIIPGANGEDIGFVRHFKANGIINQQPDGPNDLFQQMQEDDFGLRRNPSRNKTGVQEKLTAHFAANWGAPYKYGVAQISKSFDEARPVILKAVKRLTWAGEQAVTENLEPFHPFNELLSIGYVEKGTIGYHDDGEKELGPTIASLSLGCDAVMRFRPKKNSSVGVASNNLQGTKLDVLKITLQHGDIMVMHGREIQKHYEHAVEPKGKLRFALTCRYIDPAKMESDADRQDAAIKGALPPGSKKYDYDGDINAKPIAPPEKTVSQVNQCINDSTAMIQTGEVVQGQVEELEAALKVL